MSSDSSSESESSSAPPKKAAAQPEFKMSVVDSDDKKDDKKAKKVVEGDVKLAVEPIKKNKAKVRVKDKDSDDSDSGKKDKKEKKKDKKKKKKKDDDTSSSSGSSGSKSSSAFKRKKGGKDKEKEKEGHREFKLSGESVKLQRAITCIPELDRSVGLLAAETKERKFAVVQFFVNRIFKVDDVEQSVHLDMYLKVNWKSEKWIGKTDDEFQDDDDKFEKDWWAPGVEVTNAIELNKETDEDEAYWLEFPEHGILAYTQRYIGTVHAAMDLHKFPFDSQKVPITFESFHWKESDMGLLRLPSCARQVPPTNANEHWLSMSDSINLVEWNVEGIDVDERVKHYAFEDRSYSQIYVTMKISRKWTYYFYKVISILALIVLMSWSVCAMSPNELPDRTGVTVTLFLAAVAFNFVIGTQLPKISYNTKLDQYLLVTYVLITLTVIENVISYLLYARINGGSENLAHKWDQYSAVVLSFAFIVYNIYWCGSVVWEHTLSKLRKPKQKLSTALMTGFDMGGSSAGSSTTPLVTEPSPSAAKNASPV